MSHNWYRSNDHERVGMRVYADMCVRVERADHLRRTFDGDNLYLQHRSNGRRLRVRGEATGAQDGVWRHRDESRD